MNHFSIFCSVCFQIVYTEGALMQVKVHAEVLDVLTGSRDTTNDFYFTFDSAQPDLPHVVPRTYAGKCSGYFLPPAIALFHSSYQRVLQMQTVRSPPLKT